MQLCSWPSRGTCLLMSTGSAHPCRLPPAWCWRCKPRKLSLYEGDCVGRASWQRHRSKIVILAGDRSSAKRTKTANEGEHTEKTQGKTQGKTTTPPRPTPRLHPECCRQAGASRQPWRSLSQCPFRSFPGDLTMASAWSDARGDLLHGAWAKAPARAWSSTTYRLGHLSNAPRCHSTSAARSNVGTLEVVNYGFIFMCSRRVAGCFHVAHDAAEVQEVVEDTSRACGLYSSFSDRIDHRVPL